GASGVRGLGRGSTPGRRRLPALPGWDGLGPTMTRRAVRGHRGEKGGSDTASAIGPEAADHRLECGDLVAEPHGDRFERQALHEHGAEGLILTVEGLLGLDEELSVAVPLHHADSLLLIIFRPGIAVERIPEIGAEPGSTRRRCPRRA